MSKVIDSLVKRKTKSKAHHIIESTYYEDKLHSINDEPAEIITNVEDFSNVIRRWYHHGYLHRDNAPAVIMTNGSDHTEYWYRRGLVHREEKSGPAITYSDGREEWWVEGKLHREKGPAVVVPSYCSVDEPEEWWYEGKLHRVGGPAVIHKDGRKLWYIHGEQQSPP